MSVAPVEGAAEDLPEVKYAIVGAGGRHQMFRTAVTETHKDANQLVALCDVNEKRLALSVREAPPQPGNGIATYRAVEFDRMIAEQKPDTVIVTVPDYLHHEYIVRALKSGCNVITEKPMTIDLTKLKSVLDAQRETGKNVTVTFNYRYSPAPSAKSRRWISAGISIACTAPTISAAGTATRTALAACSSTRARTTSTS